MASAEPSQLKTNLETLLALQAIDTERDRAMRSRAQLGVGKVDVDAESAHEASEAARGHFSEVHGALKDAELQLSAIESKIKSYEQRQRSGQATNSREVANIEREINQLIRQRAALDGRILELMDEVDTSRVAAAAAQKRSEEASQDSATQKTLLRASMEHLDAAINRLNNERLGAVAAVADANLLKRYEALRTKPSTAGLAVAIIEEMHCSGCRTQVSSMDADRVRNSEALVLCETCGRILGALK